MMVASLIVPRRPVIALPFLFPSCHTVATESRRSQSSYARTKQRLRIKPDASFGSPANQLYDNIIHNPPSSAPSVYHTPTKFLPSDDARRGLRAPAGVKSEGTEELPPVFKSSTQKKYHLTPADIEEIRKLRLSDPMMWSRWKLAKRFECSPMFIAMVCEAGPQKKEIQRQVLEAVQSRWGTKRRMAREDRQLRKASWGKSE